MNEIQNKKTSRIALKPLIVAFAVMAIWGSLYPMIKIGYSTLSIDSSSIPSILLFAGVRFALCGVAALGISAAKKEKILKTRGTVLRDILLVGLFSIVLHYALTYIGMTTTDSSKTALIKQIGTLAYICCSPFFFRDEHFSIYKLIGAVLGFAGIFAINFTGQSISFSVGDILILLSSVCIVVSSIANKNVAPKTSPYIIIGISQLTGGILLTLSALIMGGASMEISPLGILSFSYICIASTVGYLLWNYVLKSGALSKLFIIKFAEPLFACLFGALLLGEDILKLQYLFAFILISAGILLASREK